jgi:hypothetical protein
MAGFLLSQLFCRPGWSDIAMATMISAPMLADVQPAPGCAEGYSAFASMRFTWRMGG